MINNLKNSNTEEIPHVKGLVLIGGKSSRMGKDKSQLNYFGKPQKEIAKELLENNNLETFYSVAAFDLNQSDNKNVISSEVEKSSKEISDIYPNLGPIGGIFSAFKEDPNSAWFVLATDLPFVNDELIKLLLEKRNPKKVATSLKGKKSNFIEPLITIYEPKAYAILSKNLEKEIFSPRKIVMNADVEVVEVDDNLIRNINTPQEFKMVKTEIDNV